MPTANRMQITISTNTERGMGNDADDEVARQGCLSQLLPVQRAPPPSDLHEFARLHGCVKNRKQHFSAQINSRKHAFIDYFYQKLLLRV